VKDRKSPWQQNGWPHSQHSVLTSFPVHYRPIYR